MPLPQIENDAALNLKSLARLRGLTLGSKSPRRRELLERAGISFELFSPQTDESPIPGESPEDFCQRVALAKARETLESSTSKTRIHLGGDTVVVLEGEILGKPIDSSDAHAILTRLSGATHTVLTAIALATIDSSGEELVEVGLERTQVTFHDVTSPQIDEYIATGDPLDKAGAYGAQELGAFLVDCIAGRLDNVIGLPLKLTDQLASKLLKRLLH
ncbi:MAG: septum formation protein Maf [candidate division Zixibacteria bacterium]|nr:septum formation protein Maf [candidate division Zixibacteria bacterium]